MVNEIEDFSECSSDISDVEETVNTENTDDTKLISPSRDISKMPVNLTGPKIA